MKYLVSLYFDEKTNKQLRTYIADAAQRSGNLYMIQNNVPPHITISAFEIADVEEDALADTLEQSVELLKRGSLQWITVGAFIPGVIYLAPVLNDYLHGVAESVYAGIKQIPDVNISKYYQPFQWLPHTIIGKKLSDEEMRAIFRVLQERFVVIKGHGVRIGQARKNPYREIRTWVLSSTL